MNVLFQPIRLGPLTLKNRLLMTAMSTRFAGPRGQATERLTEYYAARAAGGTALITVEEAYIHPLLPHIKNALGVYGDHLIPGLKHLADRIHEEGALASLQIGHYFRTHVNGFPRYVASIDAPFCDQNCKELNPDEIRYLTGLFADAAFRTRSAGFDAVEIHACHGCIISEFLSPYWNHRKDEYGGSREGRFRFLLEILAALRERLGPEYPVIVRISGSEFVPNGFTPEDAVALSKLLEAGGASAINISGGLGHENHVAIPPSDVPRGLLPPIGKMVKQDVSIPVIVGNSMTPELAGQTLQNGQADIIGLGRPLIADPEWPTKVREGRLSELRRCIRCNQGCFGALNNPRRKWISCMYNPVAGREFEQPLKKAKEEKLVVVVGGGPSGCEVARVARQKGHRVMLLEKTSRLGGQFNLASVPPNKADFRPLVQFYERELIRIGVDVRFETLATQEMLDSLFADVYVIAAGSIPSRPPIPGVNLPHVSTAHDVLAGNFPIDSGPVVVIGGGASGLETADFISKNGIPVTVVEMLAQAGQDVQTGIGVREALFSRLSAQGVELLPAHRAMAIDEQGVVVSDRPLIGGGNLRTLPARFVVLSLGNRPADNFAPQTRKDAVWYKVGDSSNPGNAYDAIHQAFEVAITI
ncbi:MAG: FAD-dependent oxidoreductase [Desulfobacteraceae bacterium]|nr:FAD-dependent oxidoreductase [Desulfobacteraceae bacterium]